MATAHKTNVQRPLSPHLQIYRWPITMFMSIMHRMTGCALGVGTLLLAWWLVAAASGPVAYAHVHGFMGSILGRLILLGFTFALFFHLGNGVRHLFWDAGKGFELKAADSASYAVLAGAALLTLVSWILAYSMRGM